MAVVLLLRQAFVRRRVWSEEVPWETLRQARVLEALVRFDLELVLAVRPGSEDGLPALLGACADAGVRTALWPMLSDADGRWASARNAGAYTAFVRRLLDGLLLAGVVPAEVAVDLEPPIADVRALLGEGERRRGLAGVFRSVRAGLGAATGIYSALCDELRERGVRASAAVVPLALAGGAWPLLMGTPADGPRWDHLSVMLYTSILEGWSRGWLDRADVRALLARGCRAAVDRFGARAGVSLGAVGVGAFGNEPTYRDPSELAEDVAIARAAGVEELTLLDLGGVLGRPPVERWFEAFVSTEPARVLPATTPRARVALLLVSLGGGLAPSSLWSTSRD